MPPHRRAGKSAFVEKFIDPDGRVGWVIHCRICGNDEDPDKSWSSRAAGKRLRGRIPGKTSDPKRAMDLYCIHMSLHHAEHEQPTWTISNDMPSSAWDCEAEHPTKHSEDVELLRKIFGQSSIDTRALKRLNTLALNCGHKVTLPAEKIPGVSRASQGWACTCGQHGHVEPTWDAKAQKEAGRNHLREVVRLAYPEEQI